MIWPEAAFTARPCGKFSTLNAIGRSPVAGIVNSVSTGTTATITNVFVQQVAPHNLYAGAQLQVANHLVNTGINGYWCVVRVLNQCQVDIGYQTVTPGMGGTLSMGLLAGILTTACNASTTVTVLGDFTQWNTLRTGLPAGRCKVWINRTNQAPGTAANCEAALSSTVAITYNSNTNTSTITLANTLAENKEIGSIIVFTARNVLIQSNAAPTAVLNGSCNNNILQYCEFRSVNATACGGVSGLTLTGSSFITNLDGIGSGSSACSANYITAVNGTYGLGSAGNSSVQGAVIVSCVYGVYLAAGTQINGSLIFGCTYGEELVYGVIAIGCCFQACTNISSSAFGCRFDGSLLTSCANGLIYSSAHCCSGALFSNVTTGILNCANITATGAIFAGCGIGIEGGSGQFRYCTFGTSSTADIVGAADIQMLGCSLNSTTQFSYSAVLPSQALRDRAIAYNIGGVSGAIKAYNCGGQVTYPSGTYPTGSQAGAQYGSMDSFVINLLNGSYANWYDSRPMMLAPTNKC